MLKNKKLYRIFFIFPSFSKNFFSIRSLTLSVNFILKLHLEHRERVVDCEGQRKGVTLDTHGHMYMYLMEKKKKSSNRKREVEKAGPHMLVKFDDDVMLSVNAIHQRTALYTFFFFFFSYIYSSRGRIVFIFTPGVEITWRNIYRFRFKFFPFFSNTIHSSKFLSHKIYI